MAYACGPYRQRGRGLGGIISSLFRSVVPALKTLGGTIARSGLARSIGKSVLDSAKRGGLALASDVLDGRSAKASVASSLASGRRELSKVFKEHPQHPAGQKRGRAAAPPVRPSSRRAPAAAPSRRRPPATKRRRYQPPAGNSRGKKLLDDGLARLGGDSGSSDSSDDDDDYDGYPPS
jgi:hypothetical protein